MCMSWSTSRIPIPSSLADVGDEPRHVLGLLEVHPCCRLVEQQQFRGHGEGTAQFDALLDAVREHGNVRLAVLLDVEKLDDPLDDLAATGFFASSLAEAQHRRRGAVVKVLMAPQHQVVENRELRKQLDVLERACHPEIGDLVRFEAEEVAPLEPNRPLLRVIHAADAVEDRSLAGAVGTDDGEYLAATNGERHAVDRLHTGKRKMDVVDLEKGTAIDDGWRQNLVEKAGPHDNHRFLRR